MQLLKPLSNLNGVGAALLSNFRNILPNHRIVDLLFHLPVNLVSRNLASSDDIYREGDIVTIKIEIDKYKHNYNRNSPFSVIADLEFPLKYCKSAEKTSLSDISQVKNIYLDFFHLKKDYIEKILPIGQHRIISGRLTIYRDNIHIIHPDYIFKLDEFKNFNEAIYPLTKGISHKIIRKFMQQSLYLIDELPEWQDDLFKESQKFSSFKAALFNIHNPKQILDFTPDSNYIKRLAYDEFLAMQLSLQLMRRKNKVINGNIIKSDQILVKKLIENLPFALTNAQNRVMNEIISEQSSPKRMMRLIQGDVGCGKTIIAIIAALNAIASGYQVAFMVPTAIVAKQHFDLLSQYLENFSIKFALFTGAVKGKKRKQLLEEVLSGEIKIVIGTHALFYEAIQFHNLGLAIIDEQHRFGVEQRFKLLEKGYQCDLLLMSATPIPRTLSLTIYGDMDISIIDQKPENRKEIDTRVISMQKFDQMIAAITRAIKNNEKIYWICPLVNESEQLKFSAVEERYKEFKKIFGKEIVAMVHGQMAQEEKDQNLQDFLAGKYKILLATTVVEVGVNVPDATIMIIEHADRFGLAQLHQLRGRVGRGDKQGVCILMYDNKEISANSIARLKIMHETNDGFRIAEEDLKTRGAGDVVGVKQSGLPEFKIANLKYHYDLLKTAHRDAKLLLNQDPELNSLRGKAAQKLLAIFNYDSDAKHHII